MQTLRYAMPMALLLVGAGCASSDLTLDIPPPASAPATSAYSDTTVDTAAQVADHFGTTAPAPVPTPAPAEQPTPAKPHHMTATLHTTKGEIVLEFLPEQAPKTVENFVKLAKDGFYDGVKFHRVIKGFMIQGGDPLSKDDARSSSWGTGGPGYTFADEISATNSNDVGTISMANAGPNTNGSQFFINVQNNAFLNPKHTVFGRVTKGMDVVKAIETTPVGAGDRPVTPMVIERITVATE
jgi:cyclophilin family peptidyl-prolyl cis-trans isomerase